MRAWRFICILGSIVISLTIIGGGSAFAANQRNSLTTAQAKAQWQQAIAKVHTPSAGCYHASFPSLKWQSTACLVAPKWPLAPRQQTAGGPLTVGNGTDYSAQVSGTISKATGTFDDLTKTATEKGQVDARGAQVANAFSLQLNSEFFSTPVCSESGDPSQCQGWQQFVYAFHASGHTNLIFMQYWLIDWNTTCPAGWYTYSSSSFTDCYSNSAATAYGALTAQGLSKIALAGTAASGGNDQMTLSNTSGKASSASGKDSVLDLASAWNTAEFGVYGDAGGGEANFSAKTTLEAQTTLAGTSSSAPSCVKEGFTGETNNLTLTKTPKFTSSSPTMITKQANTNIKAASCATGG
jgi:hypothetical protein